MKNRIEKLLEKLCAVPKDKYQHFAVGAVLAATVLLVVWGALAGAAALLPAEDGTAALSPADGARAGAATCFGSGTATCFGSGTATGSGPGTAMYRAAAPAAGAVPAPGRGSVLPAGTLPVPAVHPAPGAVCTLPAVSAPPAEVPAAGDAAVLPSAADSVRVLHRWAPLLLSAVAVLAAALVKEHRIDAQADLRDILATLAGGAVVWAVVIGFNLLVR